MTLNLDLPPKKSQKVLQKSNTLWIQTYYDDLKFIFETKLNLYLTEEFTDFVYEYSDSYVTSHLDKTPISEIFDDCNINETEFLKSVNKSEMLNVFNDIKQYIKDRYIEEILSKCTFDIFYDWITTL